MAYHSASNRGHPIIDKNAKIRATNPSLTLVHQGSSYRPFEICAFNVKDSKFYQLCNDNQSARDCRVTTVDNFIYICRVVDCGGGTLLNSMIRFDPRHTKIDELNACRLLRLDPALVSRGQWLYMFGGSTDPFAVLDEVECYDVRTNTWMNLLPLPQPIHSHSATVYKDVIYICGGMDINRQPLASLHVYDPTSQQWESKSPMQVARRLHVMLTLGELVFVVGGIGSHSFHQQTQIPIESYSPATDQWTGYSSTLAGRSIGHFLTLNDDKIVSIGREHYEATEDDIWEYDTKNDTWKSMVKVPRQMGLQTASGVLLHINFSDDKVAKKVSHRSQIIQTRPPLLLQKWQWLILIIEPWFFSTRYTPIVVLCSQGPRVTRISQFYCYVNCRASMWYPVCPFFTRNENAFNRRPGLPGGTLKICFNSSRQVVNFSPFDVKHRYK